MTTTLTVSNAAQRARFALNASPIYSLRKLSVSDEGESLRLTGRVKTYYHKQMAQEVVRAVADDNRVVNDVYVG